LVRLEQATSFTENFGVEHELAAAIDLAAACGDHFNAQIGRSVNIFFADDAKPFFAKIVRK